MGDVGSVGDHFYKAFVDDVKGAILLDDLYLNNSLFKPRVGPWKISDLPKSAEIC